MLIRECAPLYLTQNSGWGGVSRGWARIGATHTMSCGGSAVKGFWTRPSRVQWTSESLTKTNVARESLSRMGVFLPRAYIQLSPIAGGLS